MKYFIAITILIIAAALGFIFIADRATQPGNETALPTFSPTPLPTSSPANFLTRTPVATPTASPHISPSASPSASPSTQTHRIRITANGFEPSELRIHRGDTVVFENTTIRPAWPASEVHPTHQILPEFNAKRSLNLGETYNFTFTKIGEFPIHDHLKPSLKGKIIVTN